MKQDRPSRIAFRAEETPPEIAKELLDAIQRDVDNRIGPNARFRSVSRANWEGVRD